MHNSVCEWFEGGYDKLAPEDRRSVLFIWNRDILERSNTPLAALHHFLAEREAEAKAGDEDGQMRPLAGTHHLGGDDAWNLVMSGVDGIRRPVVPAPAPDTGDVRLRARDIRNSPGSAGGPCPAQPACRQGSVPLSVGNVCDTSRTAP